MDRSWWQTACEEETEDGISQKGTVVFGHYLSLYSAGGGERRPRMSRPAQVPRDALSFGNGEGVYLLYPLPVNTLPVVWPGVRPSPSLSLG